MTEKKEKKENFPSNQICYNNKKKREKISHKIWCVRCAKLVSWQMDEGGQINKNFVDHTMIIRTSICQSVLSNKV